MYSIDKYVTYCVCSCAYILFVCARVFPAQFGCLSWSECENKLLYVAEKSRNTSVETQDGKAACEKVIHTHTDTHTKEKDDTTSHHCVFLSFVLHVCVCDCAPTGPECVQ